MYLLSIRYIYSFFFFFVIQGQRVGDHMWRWVTGLPTNRRSAITPYLYLGGQYGIKRLDTMKRVGITAIVNMRTHSIHKEGDSLPFRMLHLPTRDRHAPTMDQLRNGVRFMEKEIKQGGKVYVHCRFGEGRGATMAIAYFISQGMTYEDAHRTVKGVRTFISPTKPQVERLREFEEQINK